MYVFLRFNTSIRQVEAGLDVSYRTLHQRVDRLGEALNVPSLDHCTTTKKHDAKIGPQVARRNAGDLLSLAADRAYDRKPFRDELRADRIRPLIKHRIYSSLDHAHNARMSSRWYKHRWMVETVFSSLKRTLGSVVRARSWHFEFRETVLKCAVYNLHRTVRYP